MFFGILLFLVLIFFNVNLNFNNANNTASNNQSQSPTPTSVQETQSPSPSPTMISVPESWETSTDEVAGYSISHPPDWEVRKTDQIRGESQITSYAQDEISQPGPVPANELKISIVRFLPGSTVRPSEPEPNNVTSETSLTLSGETATRRVVENRGESIVIRVTHQEDLYVITAIPANSDHLEVFDTMLQTFSFVPTVRIESPTQQSQVQSPIAITGSAPGTWFFEGQLTATLVSSDTELGSASLQAESDWMTEDAVEFSGELEYSIPSGSEINSAELIINKANPSGLPQNERQAIMRVRIN